MKINGQGSWIVYLMGDIHLFYNFKQKPLILLKGFAENKRYCKVHVKVKKKQNNVLNFLYVT